MTVAIGCDPNAAELTRALKEHIASLGHALADLGSDDPVYANVAIRVAEGVAARDYETGILVCGTGIGMSIAANKVHGAYAALCSDTYSAERARKSNNATIMTIGAQVIGVELAKKLVTTFLEARYTPGGRSEPKIQRIYEYAGDAHA